jgi:hypothetical protein
MSVISGAAAAANYRRSAALRPRRPMRLDCDPGCRRICPHPEDPLRRLDLVAGAPAHDERTRKGGVYEGG